MSNFWVCPECAHEHGIEIPEGQATTCAKDRSWCSIGQHQLYGKIYWVGEENAEDRL